MRFDETMKCLKYGRTRQFIKNTSLKDFKRIINKRDKAKDTFLTIAARKGYLPIVKKLIELGANLEVKNNKEHDYLDNLSLYIISQLNNNQYKKISQIFKDYPDINLNIQNNKRETAESVFFTKLLKALKSDDLKTYNILKKMLPQAAFKSILNHTDTAGDTILMIAAEKGNVAITQDLIKLGAHTGRKNKKNLDYLDHFNLAIEHLRKKNKFKEIQKIVEIYPEVISTNRVGETEEYIFNLMMESLGDKEPKIFNYYRQLLGAERFKLLIDKKDKESNSFLLKAAILGHINIILDLIHLGADQFTLNKEGNDYIGQLSLAVLNYAKKEKYEKIQSILSEFKEVDFKKLDSKGNSAEEIILKALIKYVKQKNNIGFAKLKSALPANYLKHLVNIEYEPDTTVLTEALFNNDHDFVVALTEAGAENRYNFYDKQHEFYKLKLGAFSKVSEFKMPNTSMFYSAPTKNIILKFFGKDTKEEKTIDNYSQKKSFQKQFYQLLNLYIKWGEENKCTDQSQKIKIFKDNIFLTEYSGMQSNAYFESMKSHLEKILAILNTEAIPLEERQTEYYDLCNNFSVCAPGIYTHIEDTYGRLCLQKNIDYWLAECRSSIIRSFVDKYNSEEKISAGNSIHSLIAFNAYAIKQGWNPLFNTKELKDQYEHLANIKNVDQVKFHHYFVNHYNYEVIRKCIQVNIDNLLIKICQERGFIYTDWNQTAVDFNRFTGQVDHVLAKSKMKMCVNDYCEFKEDNQYFRLDRLYIINKISEKFIPNDMYYRSSTQKYERLIPLKWCHERDEKKNSNNDFFDFKIWEEVSPKQFIDVFFKIVPLISAENNIDSFINNLPLVSLLEIANFVEYNEKSLEKINDVNKRDLIKILLKSKTESLNGSPITLFLAAELGRVELLERLIDSKADVTVRNQSDETLAYIAAKYGYEKIIDLLSETDLLKSTNGTKKWTPAHAAAFFNQPQIIKLLAKYNVDLNVQSTTAETPLLTAAYKGHIAVITGIMENVNKISIEPIIYQSSIDVKYRILIFLQNIISANHSSAKDCKNIKMQILKMIEQAALAEQWDAPLSEVMFVCAEAGQLEILKALVDTGFNYLRELDKESKLHVNIRNKDDATLLMVAAMHGRQGTVSWLLNDKKNTVHDKDLNGNTALIFSSIHGHRGVVEQLLEAKSNIETCNNDGSTALDLAIQNNIIPVVALLLENNAVIKSPALLFDLIEKNAVDNPYCLVMLNKLCKHLIYAEIRCSTSKSEVMELLLKKIQLHLEKLIKLKIIHKQDVKHFWKMRKENIHQLLEEKSFFKAKIHDKNKSERSFFYKIFQ